MDLIKLLIIFSIILFFIRLNKPLYISIIMGIISCIILYKIPTGKIFHLFKLGIFDENTINLILAFYTITFIQRMMEKRQYLLLVEQTLDNIFNSKRINTMIAPFIIGLLPSAGAVLIAAPIVNNSASDHLNTEEKAFVASYFRHISEAFLPTYSSILLALKLGNINTTKFVLAMIPMIIFLFILGYLFYVRKIPKGEVKNQNINKKEEMKKLFVYLWPIALVIILILAFGIQVYLSSLITIIIFIVVNKFSFLELKPMVRTSFETKLIISTICIMIFSKFITYTGVINRLPGYFNTLKISPIYIFALIFIVSTLVAGSQATIALAIPLAFISIPNGGLPLMILLMCIIYITMQISPTHICLAVVTEHFDISFIKLLKKTLPIFFIFLLVSFPYAYFLYYFNI
ncbi:DUF401 family protein [Cetobacterium sp.]|uniref:DUF401 family protein n=1 Tax=Cetobacterium sp. TaxID=2071632 RepID=UPI002FCB8631